MTPKLLIVVVLLLAQMGHTHTASASGLSAKKLEAKKTYYHTNGYISAIWKNARTTVYHPNLKVRNKWWAALKYLKNKKSGAWIVLHPPPKHPVIPRNLLAAFSCIHHYEGAWNANTGNGFYGGLQMDRTFQSLYGADFIAKWGTADRWPPWAQLTAAVRAYRSGRGFYPWPNTARACGLI